MSARHPPERVSAAVVAIDPARAGGYARATPSEARGTQRISLLAALIGQRVPERLAHALADDASRLGHEDSCRALASALEIRMRAKPIDYLHANAILLKGPNGSGKTSVAAKIAAQACLSGRDVTLMAAEATAMRLHDLQSRLKLRIVPMASADDVARAIAAANRRKSFLVLDTHGFNPRHAKACAAFDALTQAGSTVVIGVVSALYDAGEMADLIAAVGPERIVVTSLDLARRAGALAIAATHKIPLAHVARSPLPGDGLEPLTPLVLARTLLRSDIREISPAAAQQS